MHVLILPSWYPKTEHDITGSFFREQAHAMRQAGCRVGVLAPLYRSLRRPRAILNPDPVVPLQDDAGIPTIRVPILNLFARVNSLASWQIIRHLAPRFDEYVVSHGMPDIVHVHSLLPAGDFASWLQETHRIPFIVTEHSTAFARGVVPPTRLKKASRIARMATRRLAVSKPFAGLLEQQLGSTAGAWEVFPNMVSDRFFVTPPRNPGRRTATFCFLGIGTLERKKRFDLVLKAFTHAFGGDPGVHLRIGGDGPERSALEALAHELDISDCVSFPGRLPRDAVRDEMHNADAFVLGSDAETFGVVLIEALACGLPIIATRCGGPEDIVNASNGVLVPPGSVAAIAEAMNRVRANRHAFQPDRIRDDCRARFGRAAFSEGMLRVYVESLAAGKPR